MNRSEIIEIIKERKTFLCVGLDTDIKKMPAHLGGDVFAFNRAIIDATAEHALSYKINIAFYESMGLEGWKALDETVAYLHKNYPKHFIIADAKRGDIGNTSAMYARAFFEAMDFDAVTVAPYMGEDSVTPFLGYEGKWVIMLALTSNKGSMDFQLMEDKSGERLFERVLKTGLKWAGTDKMMYVVGATRADMLADVRRIVPDSFLLVPGIGAQGGSLAEVCEKAMTKDCGLIVNSSRAIIYASNGEDFAEAAGREAKKVHDEMSVALAKHGVI